MGLCNLQRGASIFSAALGRQKIKNIVPTFKNSASDGWVWAREIRKGRKHWNPPCLQHLWESPTLCWCTSMVISEFPSGLALIDKLQSPWTTLLDFKGRIFLKKETNIMKPKINPCAWNVDVKPNTQEGREENWMGTAASRQSNTRYKIQDTISEQPQWQETSQNHTTGWQRVHRVPKPRQPENNPWWENGKCCFRGAEALISSQAPLASLAALWNLG